MSLKLRERKQKGTNYVAIDADSLVYSIGFAAQKKNEQGELVVDNIANILHSVKMNLNSIIEQCEAGSWDVFISGKDNFRNEVSELYKSKRTADKPLAYNDIRNYLKNVWNAIEADGCEADDLVSIKLWEAHKKNKTDVIAATIDKDIRNTPGRFYNYKTEEFSTVTLEQANYNLAKQCLTGDWQVDQVLGCGKVADKVYKSGKKKGQKYQAREGIGPKEAEKILSGCSTFGEMLCAIGVQYAIMFDDPEDTLWEQVALLHMLREPLGTYQPGEEILGKLYEQS